MPCLMSRASPRAFSLFMSIITISDAIPSIAREYAIVEPTLPVPMIEILFIITPSENICFKYSIINRLIMQLLFFHIGYAYIDMQRA